MLKRFKLLSIGLVILSLFAFYGCKKEQTTFEKQFDSDSKKIKAKIDQVDNSLRNIEITIATMKSDFLLNSDKVGSEISNIKKTQTELRETLNNLVNVKLKAGEDEGGKTPFLWIIIYIIIFIVIIWGFFKFFKGKSEDEESNEFTTFTYEGEDSNKEQKDSEK